ncbi:MC019 [Molluscum contagiosum virus subtype 2]|uniref:MC019 n=2 Tax=Molluscum contagiosum virus TaxID=10279 RepID=A0A1S7DLK6_MCV2|nr:MC019 [Molluscum contagiosum virus subtype 2]QHW16403.1 MC019L [Molluscum contagiosum virus]AYO87652.1 MC019 [Molluscum contagiosum virus subtype 2]AYO87822.1 MC019 [Molluscum contagiosum virus subtype 2]AYO87992.1 MC019 [Molluscum contagiosum virus subtype 2]
MRRLLGISCMTARDGGTDEVRAALQKQPCSEVYARLPCGRGVVVNADTFQSTARLCALQSARVLAECPVREMPSPPAPALVMAALETDSFFSPQSSATPLAKILFHRASGEDNEDLLRALLQPGEPPGLSLTDINWWLQTRGLGRYCFMTLSAFRARELPRGSLTLIDDMVVGCLGYHAIWVKDPESYTRPEIDIHRYDVQAVAAPENWAPLRARAARAPMRAMLLYARAGTGCAPPEPYMISVYPEGRVFFDADSGTGVIADFLHWLLSVFTEQERCLYLVGFLSGCYDLPLLRAYWPRADTGWRLLGRALVYRCRYTAVLLDAAPYAHGLCLREYCEHWAGASPRLPSEMESRADVLRRASASTEAAVHAARLLGTAVCAQQDLLRRVMPTCDFAHFPDLSSMAIANAALLGACAHDARLFDPVHPDAVAFVRESMLHEHVGSLPRDAPGTRLHTMHVRSVIQHLARELYPTGKPYYTQTLNPGRLALALCKVRRRGNLQIPFLFSKRDPDALAFDAVLTSIDVNNAVRMGGYQIQVQGALEWERSEPVLAQGVQELLAAADAEGAAAADLVAWVARTPHLLQAHLAEYGPASGLLLAAFAVSYCRAQVHKVIAEVDNHYYSSHVRAHSYNCICVPPALSSVLPELDWGSALALLSEPLEY